LFFHFSITYLSILLSSPKIIRHDCEKQVVIRGLKTTEKGAEKFTNQVKLAILKKANEACVKATLEKYAL
jgi:hypothetical protein